MNCGAGKSDAHIMQLKFEGKDCDNFIGLTAAELSHKLGISDALVDLSDLARSLTTEEWNSVVGLISDHQKSCEICWLSVINKKFVRDRG